LASLSSGALCTDWGAAAMLSLFSIEPEAQATPAMTSTASKRPVKRMMYLQ
jgi:hypothetical protein